MTYTLYFKINLGSGFSGLTLRYKLFHSTGTMYRDWATTGITDLGGGEYVLEITAVAIDFRGYVRVEKTTDTAVFVHYVVSPVYIDVADTLLARDMASVEARRTVASRSLLNALRFLRNKVATSSSTLSVYKEDDLTVAWTAALTSDAAANPITGFDPV